MEKSKDEAGRTVSGISGIWNDSELCSDRARKQYAAKCSSGCAAVFGSSPGRQVLPETEKKNAERTGEAVNICVFGASSDTIDSRYLAAGEELGRRMAQRGHSLIFGGGATGMMGAVVRGVTAEGGSSTGIAPRFFDQEGVLYPACNRMIFTGTMRERKEKMEQMADGFIMTPGGIGTLEEFFEVLTLKQLGQHDKPIGILNTAGCFSSLEALLKELAKTGFMTEECLQLFFMEKDPEKLLDRIEPM